MFGFGKDKKEEEEKARQEKAKQEQVSQAMRSMSDQLAEKGKQIADLEDQLDDAKKDAAAKAQAEKELMAARAELAKMKAEAIRAKDQAARAEAAAAKAQAAASAAAPAATPGTVLGSAAPAPAVGGLAAGVSAWVRNAGGKNLRLRDKPGLESNAFAGLPPGTQMTLLEGPIQDDGYPWWRVRVSDGREGWVAGTELVTSPE